MKLHLRTITLLVALALLAAFAGLNWDAFTAPQELSLLFTTVVAPVGMVMLGVVVVLTAFYAVMMTRYRLQVALESGRAAKELEKTRALADSAEESRFQELHDYLRGELGEIRQLQQEQLEQSELAAVGLAETVLGETTGLERRLEHVEREDRSRREGKRKAKEEV
jgi:uncharacterized membrane protein YcjF (UPF0283 family)